MSNTRIGIENISVFGLPPVEFVKLASDPGCQYIRTCEQFAVMAQMVTDRGMWITTELAPSIQIWDAPQ